MISSVDAYPQLLSPYKIQGIYPAKPLPEPWRPSLRTFTDDGDSHKTVPSQQRYPSSQEKRRQTTSACCNANTNPESEEIVRDQLMRCPRRAAGETRPSVVIHYMPHRTFETPVLCTCIPVKLPDPSSTSSQQDILKRKCKSTGNLPHSKKISMDCKPYKSVQNMPRLVYRVAPTRTYAGSGKPVSRITTYRNHCISAKSLRKVLMKPVKALKIKLGVRRSTATKEPYCKCETIDWDMDFPVVTV